MEDALGAPRFLLVQEKGPCRGGLGPLVGCSTTNRGVALQATHGVKRRHRLADDANSVAGPLTEARRRPLAVKPLLRAWLNHYFVVIWPHQQDLATEMIRQCMRKIVDAVGFVAQIG